MEQGRGQLGAGAAERMAEGDGAAVDVDDVRIEAEGLDDRQGLGGEGLVQLDQLDILLLEPRQFQGGGDRRRSGRSP